MGRGVAYVIISSGGGGRRRSIVWKVIGWDLDWARTDSPEPRPRPEFNAPRSTTAVPTGRCNPDVSEGARIVWGAEAAT